MWFDSIYGLKHTYEAICHQKYTQFIVSEDGPTVVEYAVMLTLIIVVRLAAVSTVGCNANGKFNKVKACLSEFGHVPMRPFLVFGAVSFDLKALA